MDNNFKLIKYFLRGEKINVFLIFLLLIISVFIETLSIGAFYPFVSNILSTGENSQSIGIVLNFLNDIVDKIPVDNTIIASCIMLLCLIIFSTLIAFFAESLLAYNRYRLMEAFTIKIFNKIINNKYKYFVNKKRGHIVYLGNNACQSVGEMLLYFPKIGIESFRMFVVFLFLLTISIKISIIVFTIMLLFGLIVRYMSTNIIHKLAITERDAHGEMLSTLSETIDGIKQIKITSNYDYWSKRYLKSVNSVRRALTKIEILRVIPQKIVILLSFSSLVLIILYVYINNEENFITFLPVISVYMIAIQRMMPSLTAIGNFWMGLKGLMPRLNLTYNEITDTSVTEKVGGNNIYKFHHKIRVNNIHFSYDNSKDVLNNISFSIHKNKKTAIVGASGSGKSTIADLLVRLHEPRKGRIDLDGQNILDINLNEWRKNIGMVTQDTNVFNTSVIENITSGNTQIDISKVVNAAKLAGAHDFIKNMTKGYDTIVGDRGVKLSGGQKQRIAIARVILKNPSIIIFDEATSALDNLNERIIHESIFKLNTTAIIIAHRLSTITSADIIIVLDDGKVVDQGTHDDLMKNKGKYYHQYQQELKKNKS